MEFHRNSKKSKGSGLAGGLKISPDLENPRNFKKIHGNSWKSLEFPSKILEILSESSKFSSRGGSGPRRDLDLKNVEKPKISSKMTSGLHKMHRNGFKPLQNIVLQYFEMVPGGLTHFSGPFLRSMVFFYENQWESAVLH